MHRLDCFAIIDDAAAGRRDILPNSLIEVHMRALLAIIAMSVAACSPMPRNQSLQPGNVVPGVEVLIRDSLHLLKGKRVAILLIAHSASNELFGLCSNVTLANAL